MELRWSRPSTPAERPKLRAPQLPRRWSRYCRSHVINEYFLQNCQCWYCRNRNNFACADSFGCDAMIRWFWDDVKISIFCTPALLSQCLNFVHHWTQRGEGTHRLGGPPGTRNWNLPHHTRAEGQISYCGAQLYIIIVCSLCWNNAVSGCPYESMILFLNRDIRWS